MARAVWVSTPARSPGPLVCFSALHVGAPFGYLDWLGLFVLAVVGEMIGGLTLVTLFRLLQVPDERRENDPEVRRWPCSAADPWRRDWRASTVTPKAVDKAEQAGNSASLEVLARVGLIAFGLVHLLVGWLALLIAWGAAAGSADSSGALKTLADQPFGKIMLWLVAVGLIALALWQASEAIWSYRRHDGAERVRMQVTSGAKAVIYAALGVSAASVALGSGSSSSQFQEQTTTGVLAWPGGQIIVVAAGLIIVGVGVASVIKGVRGSFDEEIDTASMPSAVRNRPTVEATRSSGVVLASPLRADLEECLPVAAAVEQWLATAAAVNTCLELFPGQVCALGALLVSLLLGARGFGC